MVVVVEEESDLGCLGELGAEDAEEEEAGVDTLLSRGEDKRSLIFNEGWAMGVFKVKKRKISGI